MPDRSFLAWPFLDDAHRALAARVEAWAARRLPELLPQHPRTMAAVDAACRSLVRALGEDGLLRLAVPDPDDPAARHDARALCLVREVLARHEGLADFAFAMQGLGSGAIVLAGTPEQRRRWLPGVREGRRIAAFALSEVGAGSDVAALSTTATPDGDGWVVEGEKTWISNGGIADQYVLFARTGEAPGARGISAFVVDAATPGLSVAARLEVSAPHPLATLRFAGCRLPAEALLGRPGEGFKLAMATLDVFRASVGAAALGFARRALDEAAARAASRRLSGGVLADQQIIQAMLAEMDLAVDASALLVYRAAWAKDRPDLSGLSRVTREAAMAKLHATESAARVVDSAVQVFGGLGVLSGHVAERLTREVRALRIYEGATEVQKVIIARQLLSTLAAGGRP